MTGKNKHDLLELEERLGASDPTDRAAIPGTRPDHADRIREEDEVLAGLASLAPLVDPPKGLFDAIEAEIDAMPATPIETLKADEGEWAKITGKIWKKVLSKDTETGRSMYLLRCKPGALIPTHKHRRDEHVFVIEGELWVGRSLLKAGDFQLSKAGSRHPTIRTATGCLVLVHA
jgi:anti-sigma factor ChrR (cupin superfamily)